MKNVDLNGNWEPNHIGPRIEISGKDITVLWRNSPVLQTKFKTKMVGDRTFLVLKENGLKYSKDSTPYATVDELYYESGRLYIVESFPISGISKDEFTKTENSRYGAYDVVNELLPSLEGKWSSEDGYTTFTIKGNVLDLNGQKIKICVLKSKSYNSYKIVDEDPSHYEMGRGYRQFELFGDEIVTSMIVCDAPTVNIICKKIL